MTELSRPKGLFIAFEGCDRAGKSTQIDLLSTHLKQKNVQCMTISFPCYATPIGKILKKKLKSGGNAVEMSLLFTANRYEMQQIIKHYLNSGIHILCDRYKDSGRAYGVASELDDRWLRKCDEVNIEPDLVIYIDIDAELASERPNYGKGGIYEQVEFQKRVREHFHKLITDKWLVIDGNQYNYVIVHMNLVKKLKEKLIIV